MKIIISGSPKELAELARVLNSAENVGKKAELPPLLTELANDEISKMTAALDEVNKTAKQRSGRGQKNAPQVEAAEQEEDFVPPLVRDLGNRGHRKHIKRTSCASEDDKVNELAPIKRYTGERAEIMAEVERIFAEIND